MAHIEMSEFEGRREDDKSSVRVAIRIRPQNDMEKIDMCRLCTTVTDNDRQVMLGKDKAFTFDYVFDMHTQQEAVYKTCVSSLVEGCFGGYNATVFAYGQTGSGKTYTMGTGFDTSLTSVTEEIGIVPRAIDHLFRGIEKRRSQAFENQMPAPDFKVTAQFMELYNEEIIDLLDTSKDPQLKGKKSQHRIHEDASGSIYIVGVTIRPVSSLDDTLQCLKSGALSRATASTNMNISSSRSHAIFTLHIRQHRVVTDETLLTEGKDTDSAHAEFETLTAKFHFVDLAGSERLKRTGATGDRAKEGISINCGLLALGNVISALGDSTKRGSHVPYRDSKLTRLLQDSLGGNSRTLMIACVSPCDRDFMETLNTLKYANRARNIKNKVIANQDKASKQLAILRAEILALQQELIEFKTGRKTIDADGLESVSDIVVENSLLQSENDKLQYRVKALQDTVESVKTRNAQLLTDAALLSFVGSDVQATNADVTNLIKKYIHEIEDLKTKLLESESMCEHLSKSTVQFQRSPSTNTSHSSMLTSSVAGEMYASASSDYTETSVLHEVKKEMGRLQKLQKLNSHKVNFRSNSFSLHTNDSTRDNEQVTNPDRSESERNGDDGNIDEEDNDTDVEEEDSDSDSSLDSNEKDADNIHEDLANLTCEITIKQRLLEELEKTQKKMNALKAHYENRVQQLQLKIKETEMERDRVLSDIEKMSHSSVDTTKKVKQEFKKKLVSLQDELKKMQAEQRKHAKMQKNSSQYEQHLKTLQHELAEMKKSKVRLIKQVKEEVDKNKKNENRCSKELSQLRKERQRMDSIIKNLERQTAQKDAVLKRKQEEVEALRKRQKSMSVTAVGRVGKYGRFTTIPIIPSAPRRRKRPGYSSKMTKQKWDTMEKNIASVISKRQIITMLERDMDIWLKQRERCSKELEKYQQRSQEAVNLKQPEEVVSKLNKTIEDLSLKVELAQENIFECQSNIMQMEESKEDGETSIEISSLMETMTLEESQYMIEKLYQRALDKGLYMAQKESEVRELQGRLHQTELNNALQLELLRQVMDDHISIEMDDLVTHSDQDGMESTSRSSASSPPEGMLDMTAALAVPIFMSTSDTLVYKEKARKRTATTHDLLYAGNSERARGSLPLSEASDEAKKRVVKVVSCDDVSAINGPVSGASTENDMENIEGKLKIGVSKEKLLMPASYFTPRQKSIFARPSPILHRKESDLIQPSPILNKHLNVSDSVGTTSSVSTLMVSPTVVRLVVEKSCDVNVFSRLTSKSANTLTNSDRGSILPSALNRQSLAGKAVLSCTHTAVGHTKSVLSVFATDQLLFTGSKDRTAKTWDLGTGKELASFLGHPSNVQKVIYSPRTALVFTVSQSFIRVWDMRKSSDLCIKTLSSSGLAVSGSSMFSTSKQVDPLLHDHHINDLQLYPEGNLLYCCAGNFVQIWDLRRFCQIGRLSGHQAPVMALALSRDGENHMVISGSKDHYIKIFEVLENATGNLTPKYNLEPPHYDGIQSLALQDHTLFSGSRDTCIKKWDLITKQLKHSVNAAHKDWVCALNFVPNTKILLSGCRGGCLKLWQSDTCASLGEIRGHSSPINAIATNSTAVFTASNEAVVHIWKSSAQLQAEQSRNICR